MCTRTCVRRPDGRLHHEKRSRFSYTHESTQSTHTHTLMIRTTNRQHHQHEHTSFGRIHNRYTYIHRPLRRKKPAVHLPRPTLDHRKSVEYVTGQSKHTNTHTHTQTQCRRCVPQTCFNISDEPQVWFGGDNTNSQCKSHSFVLLGIPEPPPTPRTEVPNIYSKLVY